MAVTDTRYEPVSLKGPFVFALDEFDPDTVTLDTYDDFIRQVTAAEVDVFHPHFLYINGKAAMLKYGATRRLFEELRRRLNG